MNSPNNDVITARKVHRPIFAGGRLTVLPASTSSGDPDVSHGLAVNLLTTNPHTTTPARRATNATERLTARFRAHVQRLSEHRAVGFVVCNLLLRPVRCSRKPNDRPPAALDPSCHASVACRVFAIRAS